MASVIIFVHWTDHSCKSVVWNNAPIVTETKSGHGWLNIRVYLQSAGKDKYWLLLGTVNQCCCLSERTYNFQSVSTFYLSCHNESACIWRFLKTESEKCTMLVCPVVLFLFLQIVREEYKENHLLPLHTAQQQKSMTKNLNSRWLCGMY